MREFVRPAMTLHELYRFANGLIVERGYEILDYLGNLGHSIEQRLDARTYIEEGNARLLGDVAMFTFEPHLRIRGGRWGFKHENIYYFDEQGRVVEL